tara:strand:- start:364 stop:603 length:240 start_codon:yes stop_codon:yes gene_type:complete
MLYAVGKKEVGNMRMVDDDGYEFVAVIQVGRGFHTVRYVEQIIGQRVLNAWVSPNTPDYFREQIALRIYPLGVKVRELV